MRLHRGVPMLAAVATLAVTAPSAYAHDAIAPSGGVPQTAPTVVANNSSDSTGLLIGVGAAGGVALATVGVAGSRRRHRRSATAQRVGAASGS
jgi:hypothetical protein